ncbi:MAG: hypothetical protein RSD76_03965 [Clostridia bacterium]
MKKTFALLLALCLCFSLSAIAQTAPEAITALAAFEGVQITVENAALGFLIPADFLVKNLTAEQAAQGDVLSATDAEATYQLQVSLTPADINTFEATLAGTAGVEKISHLTINEVDFLTYTAAATNAACFALYINDAAVLTFRFIVPAGVDAGSIPLQIVGSVYDL